MIPKRNPYQNGRKQCQKAQTRCHNIQHPSHLMPVTDAKTLVSNGKPSVTDSKTLVTDGKTSITDAITLKNSTILPENDVLTHQNNFIMSINYAKTTVTDDSNRY